MKKIYVTPEIEEFEYEVPTLFDTEEQSGGSGQTHDEGGGEAL